MNPDARSGDTSPRKQTSIEFLPLPVRSNSSRPPDAEPTTLAMLQGLVANEGDGWKWTVEELDRYFETCAPLAVSGKRERRAARIRSSFPSSPSLKWRETMSASISMPPARLDGEQPSCTWRWLHQRTIRHSRQNR